ncbi:MAG: hypothetical protein ACM3IJ_03075 [Candidatus Levyibacteriota bacterium]
MTQPAETGKTSAERALTGLIDAQKALGTWYGTPDAIGIQSLQRAEILGMPVGVGRGIVSGDQVTLPRALPMIDPDGLIFEGGKVVAAIVPVIPEKARGHLNIKNGFPLIFPGHKQIRAAVEAIQEIELDAGNSHFSRLARFDLAQFNRPVLADGTHSLTVIPELLKRTRESATYNVKITNENGDETTNISSLTVAYSHDHSPEVLPEDFIIEAAAQTAGIALLSPESFDGEIVPLFGQVGPVEFGGVRLKQGDGVAYYAAGEGSKRGIDGKLVRVISNNEDVARIEGIKAVVGSKKLINRMLGIK